jgi:hypothetical protein
MLYTQRVIDPVAGCAVGRIGADDAHLPLVTQASIAKSGAWAFPARSIPGQFNAALG